MDYVYEIGKYEVSRDMVEKANAEGGLGLTLTPWIRHGGTTSRHAGHGNELERGGAVHQLAEHEPGISGGLQVQHATR